VIGGSGRRTLFAILFAQLASPLVLILVVASLVSLLVGDDVTAGIIMAIVVTDVPHVSRGISRRLRVLRVGAGR